MTKQSREKRIADLNDKFRKNLPAAGRVYMTAGINGKGPEFVAKALAKVIAFDDFNADNDPHREHDFGSFELEGEKLFWKIDLYEGNRVKRPWWLRNCPRCAGRTSNRGTLLPLGTAPRGNGSSRHAFIAFLALRECQERQVDPRL